MEYIEVEVLSWGRHQRKDVKKPTWFALDNHILDDPKLYSLSDSEFRALIYIFSQCSVANSERAKLYFEHAERSAKISKETLCSAVDKLTLAGVTSTSRARAKSVRTRHATDRQDRQDRQTTLPPLALLWNERSKELRKVREVGAKRATLIAKALKACADMGEWAEAIDRIADSDFCNGRVEGKPWQATFEYLLRDGVRARALEGEFDNRTAKSAPQPAGSMRGG